MGVLSEKQKRGGQTSSSAAIIYPLDDALIRHSFPSANQLQKEHTKTVHITLNGKVQVHGFLHSEHATGSSINLKWWKGTSAQNILKADDSTVSIWCNQWM